MRYYAGIGSRETPQEFLDTFTHLARFLSKKGFILRSGGAQGADIAFEKGVSDNNLKEIWLPWEGFENNKSKLIVSDLKAFETAKKYHPNWNALKQGGQKLQARNCHQILGTDLETPCDFVICWTKDGKGQGGTGQALRIAKDYNIPIFDFGKYETLNEAKQFFNSFYEGI